MTDSVPGRRVADTSEHTPSRADVDSGYVARNRDAWERWAPAYIAPGRRAWQTDLLGWGIWSIDESELKLLAELRPGGDVIELGCGTASVPAWLARRGFHPVGIDVARRQVEAAGLLQREFGISFPLIRGNAEDLHFDHESFDCAISEYGASLWCSPTRWLPEAARVLRPGGLLIFVTNSTLLMACTPADGGKVGDRLVRDHFSESAVEFPGEDGAVEFHLTHGDWIRLLRTNGFAIESLIETRPSTPGATPRMALASVEWARRWPSEEIWVARKTA